MTGIDIIIFLLFLSGILLGIVRGFVSSVFDLLGIIIGVILASQIYRAPVTLFERFNITGNAVDLVCFLFATLILTLTSSFLLDILRKRVEYKHVIDRILGILPGGIESITFISIILIAISVSPNSALEVQQSRLSKYILQFLPQVYEKTDQWKITLPKMIYQPAQYFEEFNNKNTEISFVKTNFSQWEGFTCSECGGKMTFDGYLLKVGAAVAPKFTCKNCGRIFDAYQMNKGFHNPYNNAPVKLAMQKIRTDYGK